jgi:uncharacterized protein YaeQ
MSMTVTLYRFQIELSDIDRGVYETLDFRVAQHPSEHLPYLLTRVIAYILNFQEGLTFSATGLHDPDAPAISIPDYNNIDKLVIEIGSPSAKKLHKAAKNSQAVKVYTYKNPESLMRDLREEKIHRAEEIEFYSVDPGFLDELAPLLKRDSRWSVLFNDGRISIQSGETSVSGELHSYQY